MAGDPVGPGTLRPRMKRSKKVILSLAIVAALPLVGLVMMSWFAKAPDDLGVTDGRLTDCPSSPNCVGSQASAESHRMAPLTFTGDAAAAKERLREAIRSMPRSKIVEESERYLRVEFTTAILRFVDDVEFLIQPETNEIHFRSASRIGQSDLGANRKRMQAVREAFDAD